MLFGDISSIHRKFRKKKEIPYKNNSTYTLYQTAVPAAGSGMTAAGRGNAQTMLASDNHFRHV